MDPSTSENARLALAGELYHAFVPELVKARARCKHACNRYNNAGEVPRRRIVELWRDIVADNSPLPPRHEDPEKDEAQFDDEPWIESPFRVDYGTNLRLQKNVYINFNCTILDTCLVTIGSRTIIASNVSLYTATHPLDPWLRNGTRGPELGKEIHIGEDCFIGGNTTVLPGVKIGRGCTIGAGSVVTKDVPDMCVAAGNPARIIKRLDDNNAKEKKKTDAKKLNTKMEAYRDGRGSDENGNAAEEDERVMTKREWEDEMGRQIAERALMYGSSLK